MNEMKFGFRIGVLVIFLLSFGTFSAQPTQALSVVLYVAPGGLTSGTCDAWANACELQYALASATAGDELWVKAGVYLPTTGTDRTISFQMKNGVAIYGGFAGMETLRSQRDWETNVSILNGDLLGNDSANIWDNPSIWDNSYHVVSSNDVDETAVLDGVTITAGYALDDSTYFYWGGGMSNINSSPTIRHVIFQGNHAAKGGGGMYNFNSSPSLSDVTFLENIVYYFLEGGGGMFNDGESSPTLTNVVFNGNIAPAGGGMSNFNNSNPKLTDVAFYSNQTGQYGGGMLNWHSAPVLIRVDFIGNTRITGRTNSVFGAGMANDYSSPTLIDVNFLNNLLGTSIYGLGGGMYNTHGSSPSLTGVLFEGNTNFYGGGMANDKYGVLELDGSGNEMPSTPTLFDVIFRDNQAIYGGGMHNDTGSNPTLTNVLFDSNTASDWGGGMSDYNGSSVLTNVTFTGNTAIKGGALSIYTGSSSPVLNNVTISGNSASDKGGGFSHEGTGNPLLSNVILWGNNAPNGADVYIKTGSALNLDDSVVAGGCPAGGVCNNLLTGDPLLEALVDNGGFSETMALGVGSSAINAGNTATCADTDQRGIDRVQSPCDIGAFEVVDLTTHTPPPSKTPTVTSTRTITPTRTLTRTQTPTGILPTYTATPTLTSTITETLTPTLTATPTLTSTATSSNTPTRTTTLTPTRTLTATPTFTQTATNTPTRTPVTSNFQSVANQDGWILESGENSNTGGTMNNSATTFQLGDDASNRQYRAILSFNTASLPDNAFIDAVTIRIKHKDAVIGSNPFNVLGKLWVDIRKGLFGTGALQLTDFNSAATFTKVGSFNTKPASGWYSVSLDVMGRYNINKTGHTQFRLYFNLDDNNNRLVDLTKFLSGNAATDRPELIVKYIVP